MRGLPLPLCYLALLFSSAELLLQLGSLISTVGKEATHVTAVLEGSRVRAPALRPALGFPILTFFCSCPPFQRSFLPLDFSCILFE